MFLSTVSIECFRFNSGGNDSHKAAANEQLACDLGIHFHTELIENICAHTPQIKAHLLPYSSSCFSSFSHHMKNELLLLAPV